MVHPEVSFQPSPKAFNPRKYDDTGLSLYRAQFITPEELAARGSSQQGYYVAVLQAGDLRANGIDVVPRPIEGTPGHVELPALTYANRKSDQSLEIMLKLAEELTLRVEGPFMPESD